MMEYSANLNGMRVGVLREILAEIPDDTEINVWSTGDTGYLEGVEIEVIRYDNLTPDVNINVNAESGFY